MGKVSWDEGEGKDEEAGSISSAVDSSPPDIVVVSVHRLNELLKNHFDKLES